MNSPIVMRSRTYSRIEESPCPGCGFAKCSVFYRADDVPVHSVLLVSNRESALRFRRGVIELGLCHRCGFISNTAFDPTAHSYSEAYEETQGFSATFQSFHRRLAQMLVDDYGIRGKRVVEIGCGKGEFLSLICELGDNTGIGFDPSFVPARNPAGDGTRVEFIQEFYSESNGTVDADLICCKMTLEHIADTRGFVQTVRNCAAKSPGTLVYFQVPDFSRIIQDAAFWDIYYEHCSYFTAASLRYLFESTGFDVISVSTDYDGQYLQIFAVPAVGLTPRTPDAYIDQSNMQNTLERFAAHTQKKINAWDDMLRDVAELKQKIVLWGSGSKAVAFLSAMNARDVIEYVVDINPYRHHHFLPGTGQTIVGPEFLRTYSPNVVVAMNPVYMNEIHHKLVEVGCDTRLLTV